MAEGGKVVEQGSEVQTPTGSRAFINSAVRLIYGGGRQRRSHLLLQTGGGSRRSPRRRPGGALLARATLLTQETPPCLFRDTFSLGGEAAGANGALRGTQTHRCCCSTPPRLGPAPPPCTGGSPLTLTGPPPRPGTRHLINLKIGLFFSQVLSLDSSGLGRAAGTPPGPKL